MLVSALLSCLVRYGPLIIKYSLMVNVFRTHFDGQKGTAHGRQFQYI